MEIDLVIDFRFDLCRLGWREPEEPANSGAETSVPTRHAVGAFRWPAS